MGSGRRAGSDRQHLTAQDYARAERFLGENAAWLVPGGQIQPNWLADGVRCWYRNIIQSGKEFVLIDTEQATRTPAFDHVRLAAELSRQSGNPFEPYLLPFDEIKFNEEGSALQFQVDSDVWTLEVESYVLTRSDDDIEATPAGSESPNARWRVYVEDYNLHLFDAEAGSISALTTDGEAEHAYGTPLESPLVEAGIQEPDRWSRDAALWSPDSRFVLSFRIDTRDAPKFDWLQTAPLDGTRRPKHYSRTYPLPGDDVIPLAQLILFNVESGQRVEIELDPLPILYYGGPLRAGWIWWSNDSESLYVVDQPRGFHTYTLWRVSTSDGKTQQLISEHDPHTAIDPHLTMMGSPQVRILETLNCILWFSQRDGWGHIYRYSLDGGELQNQVTSGDWAVTEILHVDQDAETLYFTAVGREPSVDPYSPFVYRVRFDGQELTQLTGEVAYHDVNFAPAGTGFIDTYSKVDQAPVTVLRSLEGEVLLELERGDLGRLTSLGWRPPERFKIKARDGITDVYGVLFLPTWFDPDLDEQLPVLDDIYAGPQVNRAPATFGAYLSQMSRQSWGFWHAQAIAELGFAVVMVDGLGMPFRSKRFQQYHYRNLIDVGIEEHVLAIRHLATRYPCLDAERVGIFGHSAGGMSSMNAMLRFPDFYKVAVSSAGVHDHRLDKASVLERFMGLPVAEQYQHQANTSRADQLQGKVLLIHGDMDENVHVVCTMQLVDALIKANKDFDLLILPNRPHACVDDPYFIRRRWDYFVRHLLGCEPPKDYQIGGAVR